MVAITYFFIITKIYKRGNECIVFLTYKKTLHQKKNWDYFYFFQYDENVETRLLVHYFLTYKRHKIGKKSYYY